MGVAPFIKPIRTSGGTFYTFTSASEDLGFSFNNDDKKFRFSNYVLLNIPDIRAAQANQNWVQFDSVPGNFSIDGSSSLNTYLAESFQNYALNLETLITSDDDYDPNLDRSVSERVFFKWLKEIGAIRFREANDSELSDESFGVHYVEEDESEIYSRVIQYIGGIDVINNVRNKENAYSEVYIHIPTSHGRQPSILFTAEDDVNYQPNKEFSHKPQDPLDEPYIKGRDANDSHPAGLDFEAHYDSEFGTYAAESPTSGVSPAAEFYYWDDVNSQWVDETDPNFYWWYPIPKVNTYFLERDFFTDAGNDKFKIDDGNKVVEYVRSRLDGISLQFNPSRYTDIATSPTINDFGQLAESGLAQNFEFNAVAIYYELFDPLNPSDAVNNLFGILFLDNVDPISGGGGSIPRLEKWKPNPITGDNGNAYSLKVNLKFDVTAEDVSSEITINDYNTFSLDLYVDALNELKETTRIFRENSAKLSEIEELLNDTRGLVLDSTNSQEILSRLNQLEDVINSNQDLFVKANEITSLIQRNYQEILNIYNGDTSVDVTYNLDTFIQGPGMKLDKNDNGKIKISSANQSFNLNNNPRVSVQSDFVQTGNRYTYESNLVNFSNYLRITDGSINTPFEVDRDVVLQIKDNPFTWKRGQKYRISFSHGLNLSNTNGNFNFLIYSDSEDTLNTGFPYSAEIGVVSYTQFQARGNDPVIELICIDPLTYDFDIDIY